MKGIDDLLKEGATRRQAVAALGVAVSVGVAGCSSQESSGSGGQPESDPDSEPEPDPEETQEPEQQQEENKWADFNPEPMSLLEFAQKTAIETNPIYLSVHIPEVTEQEYGESLFNSSSLKYSFEDSGLKHTDNWWQVTKE